MNNNWNSNIILLSFRNQEAHTDWHVLNIRIIMGTKLTHTVKQKKFREINMIIYKNTHKYKRALVINY